jgi:UDP-N-acetylmuramyl pentapeptide phosphotransferase/UDP-N-acetylglucosamine-1-phosphate transferase
MIFVVAAVLVLYHLIMGALDWVQSAGEKEKVEKARKQITSSIIGLIILFAIIALIVVLEQIFGIGMGISAPIKFTKIGT